MCGPSNALQNFQKHSTVDRTLQQDRLIARQSPAQVGISRSVWFFLLLTLLQGFRSASQNAGYLEPEFEAFQAGQLPLDHGPQFQPFAARPPQFQHAVPGPSNWASDFSRMNISSPPPQVQNTHISNAQQRHDTSGWHQDFAQQQNQIMNQSPSPAQYQPHLPYAPGAGYGIAPQFTGGFMGQQADMAQQMQPVEGFDEAAFERAFQEAAQSEAQTSEAQESASIELGQDIMIEQSAELYMASETLANQQRIGADGIYDPDTQELSQDTHNPDAMSRIAGELLHSVRHDQSSKFQNSQFLELMRQFREGSAIVDDENKKVVNVGGGSVGGDNEAFKVAAP